SPPKGIPIVFIPGQAATWEEYSLLLPKLTHRFQVFAVSLRGHGKSSKTPDLLIIHHQVARNSLGSLKYIDPFDI
ncbi:MAG: alpha/beta fold hydrolase, partial [Candidatus Hermodarchaeota archaeon]